SFPILFRCLCSARAIWFNLLHFHFCFFRNCGDDFGEKTGILVHNMIKEIVPSISLLKLCKASLKGLYKEACLSPICFNKLKSLKLKLGVDEDCMQVMIRLLKYSPNLEVLKLWCDEDGEWRENYLKYQEWCDYWQILSPLNTRLETGELKCHLGIASFRSATQHF
ncbi:hypothetical protein AABB24_030767, partial [Solanum stoloniferum]